MELDVLHQIHLISCFFFLLDVQQRISFIEILHFFPILVSRIFAVLQHLVSGLKTMNLFVAHYSSASSASLAYLGCIYAEFLFSASGELS